MVIYCQNICAHASDWDANMPELVATFGDICKPIASQFWRSCLTSVPFHRITLLPVAMGQSTPPCHKNLNQKNGGQSPLRKNPCSPQDMVVWQNRWSQKSNGIAIAKKTMLLCLWLLENQTVCRYSNSKNQNYCSKSTSLAICSRGLLSGSHVGQFTNQPRIKFLWVNYHISLTWIVCGQPWGWFPYEKPWILRLRENRVWSLAIAAPNAWHGPTLGNVCSKQPGRKRRTRHKGRAMRFWTLGFTNEL